MQQELKNCPFCGGEPEIKQDCFRPEFYHVNCKTAACNGHIFYPHRTLEEAITAWNTRADLPPAPKAGDDGKIHFARFGHGKLNITHGTYEGENAVFIQNAIGQGEVGEYVQEENRLPSDRLTPNSIVLLFPTEQQAIMVDDALCNVSTTPTPPNAALDERTKEALEWADNYETNLRQCNKGREYSEHDFKCLRSILTIKAALRNTENKG